jgi:alpha-ketoglutarate-dependent dioxygenase FTO
MLDDFNHNHEHAVISPSTTTTTIKMKKKENNNSAATTTTIRYSSTHRVAREGRGTWQYIRDKARGIVSKVDDDGISQLLLLYSNNNNNNNNNNKTSPSKKVKDAFISRIRAQQHIMTEIEFEWLRQWHVQGQKHASLHPYWHTPILELCSIYCKLERMTCDVLDMLNIHDDNNTSSGRSSSRGSIVTEDLFDVLIESFTERLALRTTWHERYSDPIYTDIPEDERPFSCDCLDRRMMDDKGDDNVRGDIGKKEGILSEDLDMLISKLRRLRLAFVSAEEQKSNNLDDDRIKSEVLGESKKKRKRVKGELPNNASGSLTKKESKQRASNWERLKATLKR